MFHSQNKQDEFLEKNIFKGFKNGFFIDVGAHDGVTINNTLYFSRRNNWTGINVEPIASVFEKLAVNRKTDININCAVCNKTGFADFYDSVITNGTNGQEMLSGLKDCYDPRHFDRLNKEITRDGGHFNVITVPTKKLEDICDEYNVKHVHYLSIDVEGAEFEVIKSINFDKVFIDIVEFENNYGQKTYQEIVDYLQEKGYLLLFVSHDIFMIHSQSQFLKNLEVVQAN